MAWPPQIQNAEDRMKQAEAALRADVESGAPANSERRKNLLSELKRAQDDFVDQISRLR